jgi:hypothetical protein
MTFGRSEARHGRSWAVGIIAMAILTALPAVPPLQAQQTPAQITPDPATAPAPPLSPRRAFLYSLAVPGYSQSVLGRPRATAIFLTAEAVALVMIRESSANLSAARRMRDSIPVAFVDPATGASRVSWAPGFSEDHIRSRQQQVEDWLAMLVANHLFSAVDAFVAAHLWDVPIELATRRRNGAVVIAAAFRW